MRTPAETLRDRVLGAVPTRFREEDRQIDIRVRNLESYRQTADDIRNLVSGNIVSGEVTPQIQAAADHYAQLLDRSQFLRTWVVLLLAIAGGADG